MTLQNNEPKTALVLSGGGSRGAYEIGVWQALRELDVRLDMVTGTSAGAINGAVIAQDLFEPACEIWKGLRTETVFDFSELLKKGGQYTDFKKLLQEKLDEEAIRRSSVDLGIVTVEFPSMEPRYLWKDAIPKGQLLDYILASASCFPALQSYEIGDSRYIDGGYSDNMPVGMALERGASHIIAVNLDSIGMLKLSKLEEAESSVLIQSHWDLGNWLRFEEDNSRRIMRLGYLDTMRTYGVFDGEYYCFIKGQMDKRSLKGAEQAAFVFQVDPGKIYNGDSFRRALFRAIGAYEKKEEKEIRAAEALVEKGGAAGGILSGVLTSLAKLPPLSPQTLILFLAHRLAGTGVKRSLLLSKPALALFSKEISAAYYLMREGFVQKSHKSL